MHQCKYSAHCCHFISLPSDRCSTGESKLHLDKILQDSVRARCYMLYLPPIGWHKPYFFHGQWLIEGSGTTGTLCYHQHYCNQHVQYVAVVKNMLVYIVHGEWWFLS